MITATGWLPHTARAALTGLRHRGYDVKERKLALNAAEAETVRHIFRRYLALGSVRELKSELAAGGIVSKARVGADGSPYGSKPFSRGALYLMLKNRIYLGGIVHKGVAHKGEHAGIVDAGLWEEVQTRLSPIGSSARLSTTIANRSL